MYTLQKMLECSEKEVPLQYLLYYQHKSVIMLQGGKSKHALLWRL